MVMPSSVSFFLKDDEITSDMGTNQKTLEGLPSSIQGLFMLHIKYKVVFIMIEISYAFSVMVRLISNLNAPHRCSEHQVQPDSH